MKQDNRIRKTSAENCYEPDERSRNELTESNDKIILFTQEEKIYSWCVWTDTE